MEMCERLFQHTLFLCCCVRSLLIVLSIPHMFHPLIVLLLPLSHCCLLVSSVLYKLTNPDSTVCVCVFCLWAIYSIYLWLTPQLTDKSVAEIGGKTRVTVQRLQWRTETHLRFLLRQPNPLWQNEINLNQHHHKNVSGSFLSIILLNDSFFL